jgi:hypothetical protein
LPRSIDNRRGHCNSGSTYCALQLVEALVSQIPGHDSRSRKFDWHGDFRRATKAFRKLDLPHSGDFILGNDMYHTLRGTVVQLFKQKIALSPQQYCVGRRREIRTNSLKTGTSQLRQQSAGSDSLHTASRKVKAEVTASCVRLIVCSRQLA